MWPFGGSKKSGEEQNEGENATPKVVPPVSGGLFGNATEAASSVFKDEAADEAMKRESMLGFDAKALERAAKAAKELEDLKFAQEAIDIAKLKEDRRKKQAVAETESSKAKQEMFKIEGMKAQEVERRKTLQQDHELKQQQAQYSHQLAQRRHQENLQREAQMKEQQRKRDEEFQMRVEGMKRQTLEYEAKLRKDTERSRVKAEMEGQADMERKNWDLRMQRSKMEAQEYRTTVLEGVRMTGNMVKDGFNNFLSDQTKMASTAGLLTVIAIGIYGARAGTGVAARFVEARLGKPPLVRETSRKSPLAPISYMKSMFGGKGDALAGVVVNPNLKTRLQTLATSTMNTKRNGAPYRHALMYGPPGTGKTLYAKSLAQSSGMDYAILTGGDVAPLGKDAVTEIHKLFDWANTSRKGVLVFVDEADAFLRKRSNAQMSENQRNALNAFLYRTGTESKNFMVVYATNEPEDLDWAITDRTDELIRFDLPGTQERVDMLKLYFDKYVVNAHQESGGMFSKAEQIKVEGIDQSKLDLISKRMEGYSGREIAKFCIGLQAAAYSSGNTTLTPELFDQVLDFSLEQHVQKLEWDADRLSSSESSTKTGSE